MAYVSDRPLLARLARLSRADLADRLHAIRALGAVRGLRYIDDHSRPRTIELASVPWLLTRAQLVFFNTVARHIIDALLKLPRLYATDPAVRRVLVLDSVQDSWVALARRPQGRPWAVMGRLDSTAVFNRADWRTGFEMLEPNAVGVGGVHYAPAACAIISDALGDVLESAFPGKRLIPTPDPRQMLLDELSGLARRAKRPVRGLALIENMDFTTGTDEFASLARYFRARGLRAVVADPRELRLVRGALMARDVEVDFLYRDCELSEFIEMEATGRALTALRSAIRQGRLVSGLLWEFDHKSCWELFTDPAFSKHFTPAQRRLFRAHLPWTRLVRDDATTDVDGRRVDLPAFIRRHQAQLVLKPNVLYGGQGVVVGPAVTRQVWERALATAFRGSTPYVVQRFSRVAGHTFPRLDDGRVRTVDRSVVSGFFFNSTQIGLVGRFSQDPVVNVSRGGGLVGAFLVD